MGYKKEELPNSGGERTNIWKTSLQIIMEKNPTWTEAEAIRYLIATTPEENQ